MLMTCQNRWIKIVNMEDIFDLSIAKEEGLFVQKGLLLESDVASEVIDTMLDFPWIGSLIKIGRVGKNFIDLHFIRKIAKFLKQSDDIGFEKKEAFLAKLDKKNRKKMREYLMHLLYTAEEDRKAVVMGMVYRDRIMGNIDNDMFLRLCSSINRIYIEDVGKLSDYIKPNPSNDYITNNLYSSGLLQMTKPSYIGESITLGSDFELNAVGKNLLRILK